MKYLIPILGVLLMSCSGQDEKVSDKSLMEDEVKNYLFLGDSVDVEVSIADTITNSELDTLLATIEENLRLIQLDIDTLESMIDTMAYDNLEKASSLKMDQYIVDRAMGYDNWQLSEMKLKMAQLQAKKLSFKQSNRVMLHLQRSQAGSISGYEIVATYEDKGHPVELGFLMNANFKIID